MNTTRTIETSEVINLLAFAKQLEPHRISHEMINLKRDLDFNHKIDKLRSFKSIPPEYIELLELPALSGSRDLILNILLQLSSYISSQNKNIITIDDFKNGKRNSTSSKKMKYLFSETKNLLKTLKSADEAKAFFDGVNHKISNQNLFKDLTDQQEDETLKEKIDIRINSDIKSYINTLNETRSFLAAEGMQ